MENTESLWLEIFKSSDAQNKEFSDSEYKTFNNLSKNKKSNDAECFFPAFIDKLAIEKNDFRDKIKQFLLSWDTVAKDKRVNSVKQLPRSRCV